MRRDKSREALVVGSFEMRLHKRLGYEAADRPTIKPATRPKTTPVAMIGM
jgi:hypothetical protein